jgi:ankyrin repeat protein
MAAAHEEQLGIMRLLIASGADVNYQFRPETNPEQLSDALTYALNAGK